MGFHEYAGSKTDIRILATKSFFPAQEYDQVVLDLVNFLSYAGEPAQLERKRLGIWVLMFLGFLTVFSYLLKREYWKNVH